MDSFLWALKERKGLLEKNTFSIVSEFLHKSSLFDICVKWNLKGQFSELAPQVEFLCCISIARYWNQGLKATRAQSSTGHHWCGSLCGGKKFKVEQNCHRTSYLGRESTWKYFVQEQVTSFSFGKVFETVQERKFKIPSYFTFWRMPCDSQESTLTDVVEEMQSCPWGVPSG